MRMKNCLKDFESIIFDIDGTLWDARALTAAAWNAQLRAEGYTRHPITADDMTPLQGKTIAEIANILFPDVHPAVNRYALMDRCTKAENDYLAKQKCDVGYPGVKDTIAKLSESHRIFVVSNCDKGYPEICMEKLGVTPYIQDHLCFGDTQTSKGQTIRTLMARNHIESCVYVGDTDGDYKATCEAGIPFIWAGYGFGTTDGGIAKIHSIEELLNGC